MESGDAAGDAQPLAAVSIEQQLEQYKEKTKQWKQAVKVQLEDAAAKNSSLRDELKRRQTEHEHALNQLRVELNNEFVERTQYKDTLLEQQATAVERLRETHKRELEERLQAERKKAAEELRALSQEHESALGALRIKWDNQIANAAEELERQARTLENVRHELALTQAKLQQQRQQNEELQRQVLLRSDDDAAQTARAGALAEKDAESLRQQLELQATKVATLTEQLERSAEEHREDIKRRDELREDEMHRREERIVVLQTILKQTQQEANDLHLRWSSVMEDHRKQVEQQQRDNGVLALANKTLAQQNEELKWRIQSLEEECVRAKRTVAELEETNAIRDKTFQELLMSDDQRLMIGMLEQRLNAAASETQAWQEKYTELHSLLIAERSTYESHLQDISDREQAIEQKMGVLHEKQGVVAAQEKRLREQQQTLSLQASQVLASMNGQGHNRSSAGPTIGLGEGSEVSGGNGLTSSSDGLRYSHSLYVSLVDAMSNVQQNYLAALARSNGSRRAAASLLFRHYKKVLPIILIVLLAVTCVYWWMLSGTSPSSAHGERSMSSLSDLNEELRAMKREYGLVLSRMAQCCPDVSAPPALPLLQRQKSS